MSLRDTPKQKAAKKQYRRAVAVRVLTHGTPFERAGKKKMAQARAAKKRAR